MNEERTGEGKRDIMNDGAAGCRAKLVAIGLDPPRRSGWIAPAGTDGPEVRDAYRGALIGTAIGDALGRPAEGRSAASISAQFGRLSDYRRWHGWNSGPEGTVTDDTQMTMEVAGCLIAHRGHIDPRELADRFVEWSPIARGAGSSCRAAVRALLDGAEWWESGVDSAGNGAAMRAAPIGLAHPDDLDALRFDGALSAVVTHAQPMAVVSAIAHAWLIARLTHTRPGDLDPATLVEDLCDAIDDLDDPGEIEREWHQRGLDGGPVRLVDRIAQVPSRLEMTPADASSSFSCGAFVLESLPMALWHFLHGPARPEEAIVNAVMGGHDADTVASMTGAYAGAYLGDTALPERWRGDNLEFADELRRLADTVYELAHPNDLGRPGSG